MCSAEEDREVQATLLASPHTTDPEDEPEPSAPTEDDFVTLTISPPTKRPKTRLVATGNGHNA